MMCTKSTEVPALGVVGVRGGWSSELLAQRAAEACGGEPLLIELDRLSVDLATGRALFDGRDISQCRGLLLKKLGPEYAPGLLDRLEMLRFLEGRGVAMRVPLPWLWPGVAGAVCCIGPGQTLASPVREIVTAA